MKLFVLAAAGAALFASATTSAIAQDSAYYRATVAGKVNKAMMVTRDTVWRCTDGTCVAGKSTMRDAVACELVVQRAGALTAFSANGTEFDAAQLEKCNARAK